MSEPETTVEGAAPAEAGPAPEQAEAQRMAKAWAEERPNLAEELRQSREAAKPPPPPDPAKQLLGQAATKLAQLANVVTEERDQERAEREVDQTVSWAQSTATDFEAEPETVAYAAEELLDAVGPEDYRFEQFIDSWSEADPEAAQEFLVQRQWQNYWEAEDAAGEIAAAEAQALVDHAKATQAMAEAWAEGHKDMPPGYADAMAGLAQEANLDLSGDPAFVKTQLDSLYEAIRQIDPTAAPVRGALRSGFETSAAWEAAEANRILGALQGRSETKAAYAERMAEYGFAVDQDGILHSPIDAQAVVDRANTHSLPGARLSHAEFEAQEQARLSAAWGLPTVQEELHGPRRARPASADNRVDRSVREGEDPYWSYLAGYS